MEPCSKCLFVRSYYDLHCSYLVLQVDIPGPLGEKASDIIESLPNLNTLNGIDVAKIVNSGKHVIDSMLLPRLPDWAPEEPLPDRVISAMWQYLMTYRLADEEKIDETSVWYAVYQIGLSYFSIFSRMYMF